MGRKITGLVKRGDVWHINKIYRGLPIRVSTFQTERDEAERVLIQRMAEIDRAVDFGQRPARIWRDAARKYFDENQHLPSIENVAVHLNTLESYIGDVPIDKIHDGTLAKYIKDRKAGKLGKKTDGVKNRTVNMAIELVVRILHQAAHRWRDEFGMTWLDKVPALTRLDENKDKRDPYPMTWREQRYLMQELPEHLAKMALFKVNTGTREQEVCHLQWDWEIPLPELGTSVFLIPGSFGGRTENSGVKNGEDRLVVLNKVARSVVDAQRGADPAFVFGYTGTGHVKGSDTCLDRMNGHAWRKARTRAAERYEEETGRRANPGFAVIRVHDMKHTYGHRLRVAGVPFEDRQVLLGHKSKSVTTHYSAPEIGHLIEMANRVLETDNRQLVAPTILRRKMA
jgi:integrase